MPCTSAASGSSVGLSARPSWRNPWLKTVAFAAGLLWTVADARADLCTFSATLNGAANVPPVTTAATGSITATLDTTTRLFSYSGTYTGPFTSTVFAQHFHGPGDEATNAPITIGMTPQSTFSNAVTLTVQQAADLQASLWYFNVHTINNSAGEIRGQLYPTGGDGPACGNRARDLVITQGDNQSTDVGTPFPTPLQARALNAIGQPVAGTVVGFAAPGSGASMVPVNMNVATNADGRATLAVSANGFPGGPYNVQVSTSGLALTRIITLTNTAPQCEDAFAGARSLAGANGTVFGTTASATGEAGEPDHAGASGALNSVWCKWAAPANGTVTFDTTGSSFDTTLAVYTGAAVNALTPIASNNDIAGAANRQSRVTFAATQGVTYYIAVDGAGSATGAYLLNWAQAAGNATTLAAVLPYARSVQTGSAASAFATMINTGPSAAAGCFPALPPGFPASFSFQTTNAANLPTGLPNQPANIAPSGTQGFVFSLTPSRDLNGAETGLVFDCANTPPTISVPGLNTLLLSASAAPTPDLIAVGSTPSGDGIVNVPGSTGTGLFAAAAINIGAAGTLTATVDDGGKTLPVTMTLCQTNPTNGQCTNPTVPGPSATFTLASNATATFTIFVAGAGMVPFDPANNRLFLRFKTADGVTRGATNVAVRTVAPPPVAPAPTGRQSSLERKELATQQVVHLAQADAAPALDLVMCRPPSPAPTSTTRALTMAEAPSAPPSR